MREGADRLRNNTNSFLSGELVGLVPVRISVAAETEESSLRIRSIPRHHPGIVDGMFFLCFKIFFVRIFCLETIFSFHSMLRPSFA